MMGVAVLLAGIVPLATRADADPIADKQAQAARLAGQINQLNTRQEQLAERYNAARLAADQVKQQVDQAAAGLAKAGQQMDQQRSTLRDVAVDSYIRSGTGPANTSGAAGGDIAVQRYYIDTLGTNGHDAMDALRQAQLDYGVQRQQLQAAQAKAQAAVAQVDRDRKAAADANSQAQAALQKVKGDLAQLVAQKQAEEAAAAAARVKAELLHQQELAASRARAAAAAAAAESTARSATISDLPPVSGHGASAAIAEAQRQIGKPYEWGAAGPGSFDCSGLTMWAWRAGGVSLPHYTKAQYDATTHVSLSELQPGDLVFFGSDFHHEGLYVGGGQMIEAPHTGADVRYASIYRSDLIAASRPSA